MPAARSDKSPAPVVAEEPGGQTQDPVPERRLQRVVHLRFDADDGHALGHLEGGSRRRDQQHAQAELDEEPAVRGRDRLVNQPPREVRQGCSQQAVEDADPEDAPELPGQAA